MNNIDEPNVLLMQFQRLFARHSVVSNQHVEASALSQTHRGANDTSISRP
jgi:hypothetical protein